MEVATRLPNIPYPDPIQLPCHPKHIVSRSQYHDMLASTGQDLRCPYKGCRRIYDHFVNLTVPQAQTILARQSPSLAQRRRMQAEYQKFVCQFITIAVVVILGGIYVTCSSQR